MAIKHGRNPEEVPSPSVPCEVLRIDFKKFIYYKTGKKLHNVTIRKIVDKVKRK